MRIQIQFPTLARPEKFLECLQKYLDLASGKHRLYFQILCDEEDKSMCNHKMVATLFEMFRAKGDREKFNGELYFDPRTTKIGSINSHIHPDKFDTIIVASDDMIPQVQGWDDEIATAMEEYYPKLDGAVYFDDGYQHSKLITFSILGVNLYKKFGYIYHPDYKSLYCDNEFTQEVQRMGKLTYIDKCIIKHAHYGEKDNVNSGDMDYAAKKTLYFAGRDGAVFEERKRLGFPRERITDD